MNKRTTISELSLLNVSFQGDVLQEVNCIAAESFHPITFAPGQYIVPFPARR
jgi:hypothetical protein